MGVILERTGDSRWYLKHTDVAECSEVASLLVRLSVEVEDEDHEDLAVALC